MPAFSEEELLAVYDDLLSISTTPDHDTVAQTLQLPSQGTVNQELETYAQRGDIQKVEEFMSKILNGEPFVESIASSRPTYSIGRPSEDERDLHIKVHIKATPTDVIPTSALSILHSYETRGIPAPMQSYTRVIAALFRVNSSIARAHAWDLFSHMRYVAHPQPDALLYSLMIRACASSNLSNGGAEPERALDLWTEMTVDRRIAPTTRSYGAIILACARSGKKEYVNEAFRLAKEMLDSHRDAQGQPAFRPDAATFRGLLEGAKRMGDLARARWILAEMVKPRGVGVDEQDSDPEALRGDAKVDETVLTHIFHAYAAYNPPFRRSAAVLIEEQSPSGTPPSDMHVHSTSTETLPTEDSQSQFSHIPPQTASEVVGEARTLFNLVVADTTGEGDRTSRVFKNVRMTAPLLNAYLSVYYAHAPLNVAREMFMTLFPRLGVTRTARSYTEALQRCGITKRGPERTVAPSFAQDIWTEWSRLENRWRENQTEVDVNARAIESAYSSMIRVLSLWVPAFRSMAIFLISVMSNI